MSWDRWQAPDRDSIKTLDSIEVSLGQQLRLLLQMEGGRGTIDEEVQRRTGVELKRARRPHKLLERMGVLYADGAGDTRLTDLGKALREIPETAELRRRVASAAVRVLAKYQLKNPVDDKDGEYPENVDIHPYWAIWKAASELDWKLHWDELNRELFWVLTHGELEGSIQRIREARTEPNYDPATGGSGEKKLRDRAYDQTEAPDGKTPDGQVRDQKTTPWFRKAGFGGLLLEQPGNTGKGYWTVPDDLRHLVSAAVQKAPPYYSFEDSQDWYRYFGSFDAWAKAPDSVSVEHVQDAAEQFLAALESANLNFGTSHSMFVRSFLASLTAKRFVILTGLSGSGKTQIAQKLGQWFGPQHYDIVPVRPDWTGPEPLLGYEDALSQRDDGLPVWSVPRVLEFCVNCRRDPQRPFLLVLDEMNLAHVEQYFADFLSGMESAEPVLPDVAWDPESRRWILISTNRVRIPENLFVVGTVNVDETTHTFSPKVLDRAHTIEFRVDASDLPSDALALVKPNLVSPGSEEPLKRLLDASRDSEWHNAQEGDLGQKLADDLRGFHKVLSEASFEFGYRTVHESARFAVILSAMAPEASYEEVLDRVVMQKLLPRLHGSRRRFEPVLCHIGSICAEGSPGSQDFDPLAPDLNLEDARLPTSLGKVRRMLARLRADHFTSFAV